MAEVARHAPGPSLAVSRPAPPPPPTTPAARGPDSPRRGAQVTGRISGSVAHCQEASKHMQNEVHQAKEMSSSKSMLRPDSSDKQRIPKSSGGSYSKPDARVKLIPAEEITFVQHRRPNCRTVGSAGLQKRHCRRSITPPPSSRKVSVVPMPPAPSHKSSPNRLETAENGHSLIGEYITSSTNHIASLKNSAPPSCKSSQPSATSLNTDAFARDFDRMDITDAFSRYYGSHVLHSQGESSKWPASLPKEAAINSDSPSPKQVIAPQSSEDHLGTKAGPSSKAVCAPENGKLYGRTCHLAPKSAGPPILHPPIEESALLSPTSVVRQQSTVVYPDRRRYPAPILRKHVLPMPLSLLSERSIEVYPNSKAVQKEAAINTASPPKRVFGPPRSSDLHLAAKDGPPCKSVCTTENGNPCTTRGNIAARITAAPVLQPSLVESPLLSPTPVLGERSTELYSDATKTAAAPIQQKSILKHVFQQKPILKHVLPSPTPVLGERSTELHPSSKAGLKEAVINPVAPGPQQLLAPCSSADHLGTKAGPPFKSLCTPENGELCSTNCNSGTRTIAEPVLQSPVLESSSLSPMSTEVYPDRISTAVPTQQAPVAKHALPSQTSLISERSTEVHPNSSTKLYSSNNLLNGKREMVPPQHKRTPQTHSTQPTPPAQCSASIIPDASSEFHRKGVEETGAPAILHTKLHRKHYQSEAPWKGNFHVTGELKHICDGLEAQFPFQIFLRVYEASKKMPEILKLEAVALSQLWPKKFKMKPPEGHDIGLCFISSHQRPHRSYDHLLEKISSHIGLWINLGDTELSIFSSKLLSPDYQRKDGKLYFWGVFGKRLRKNQRHCSNHITSIKTRNLSQREDSHDKSEEVGQKLDWTKAKGKESSQPENGMTMDARGGKDRDMVESKEIGSKIDVTGDKVIVTSNREEIAKVLDLTGGNKTDRVNECSVVLGTLDSDAASGLAATATSLLTGCCSRDTANKSTSSLPDPAASCAAPAATLCSSFGRDWSKSTFSLSDSLFQPTNMSSAGSDLMLDKRPGVPLNVPPGFTKAQCLTEANDVSYVDAPPSVVMDTTAGVSNNIPPGFTEAHRCLPTITPTEPETGVSTPVTEKKPIIRFSLNVPRLIKKEIPPGFTTQNAVKKEPESPAVDKTTKKLTPSPLASGASPVRKITLNEVSVEDDGNSEEREVPKIRRLSELYGRPGSSTQVSRSVSSNLADKFQGTEQPEKQKHQGKRGMQGPWEPSLADTAKRLKVNGRVALSNGADRQTLNSNHDQENCRG